MNIEERLRAEGIVLPDPAASIAAYVPYLRIGDIVSISGQLPISGSQPMRTGRLGDTLTTAEGQEAARLCAINLLAQMRHACGGDLKRIRQVIRLGGFVACTSSFTEQSLVINGASNLMIAILGDAGRHTRSVIGVSSLPLGAAVEIEAVVQIV